MNSDIIAPQNQNVKKEEVQETKQEKKRRLLSSIVLGVFFSFNLCVYGPLEGYLSNVKNMWFGLNAFMPALIILFLVVSALVFCLCYFTQRKISNIISAFLLGISIAFYIQTGFLNGDNYGFFDGGNILWEEMKNISIINTATWIIILSVPLLFLKFNKKHFSKFISLASGFVLLILAVNTGHLMISTEIPAAKNCYLSTENQFKFSKENNIVLLVSDTFEAQHLTRAIEEYPELKSELKDFIYYENTTGISTYTYLSMATIMTGNVFPNSVGYYAGLRETFEETDFFDRMHEMNFDVNYYTNLTFFKPEYMEKMDNLEATEKSANPEVTKSVSKQLYKLSLFKYMPHILKSSFTPVTEDFDATQGKMDYPVYVLDDLIFNNKILDEGFETNAKNGQYSMFHLRGLHAPVKYDKNFEPVTFKTGVSYNDRRYEAALGQINLLKNFVAELKEQGIYDNTTIIFTSDHGNVERYNPVFLVKPADADEEFKVSQAPVSLIDDLIPFILDVAEGKGRDAALYSIPENQERERFVYSYYSTSGYGGTNMVKTTISVNGHAGEESSYYLLQDEYNKITETKSKYKLGQNINFEYTATNAKVYGFRTEGWAWSRTARLEIEFGEHPSKDISAVINIVTTVDQGQKMIIKYKDTVLFEEFITPETKQIEFTVPQSAFEGTILYLDFEFPDTRKNTEDIQGIGWLYYESFQLKNISFK